MKKLGLIIAAVVASMSAAQAADVLPVVTKAPRAVAVASPAYDWSGFYIGAMGGYGWSGSDFNGGFAGGTIGGNVQFGNLVIGAEGEGAWSGLSGSTSAFGLTATDKITAFGSIAGRVGYAAGNVLIYGKGGFAIASNTISVSGFGQSISDSQTHYGYTVGAGIEYGFTPNWSVKGEYLYTKYQSASYFASLGGLTLPAFDVQTVKLGINYRFGWGGRS